MAASSLAELSRSGIYEIVNTVNGKRYVGSAALFTQRFAAHRMMLRRGTHHSRYLQAAWAKYGEATFAFTKLVCCAPADLLHFEQMLIDELRPEYNICRIAGNALGVRWSDEAKARHSLIQKANPTFKGRKHTPETLAKMAEAQRGRPSPLRGIQRDAEAVERTAAAHRGRKRSEETRAKIAERAKGRACPPRSDEYRAKLSAAHKGRPKSAEHMAALQEGRRTRVVTDEQKKAVSDALKAAYASGLRAREKTQDHKNKISRAFSKLGEDDVRTIRRLHAGGATGRALSRQFESPASTISQIVRGLRYRWVTD